jgi:hypothetical protein
MRGRIIKRNRWYYIKTSNFFSAVFPSLIEIETGTRIRQRQLDTVTENENMSIQENRFLKDIEKKETA